MVDAKTPHGTKLFSYNLYLNITEGAPFLEFHGNYTLDLYFSYQSHFHNGDLASNEFSYDLNYRHYYRPTLGFKFPGMEVSSSIYLTGPFEVLFPLSNAEIQKCRWRGSTFIKIPLGIYLLSPYLYHLGVLRMYLRGSLRGNSQISYLREEISGDAFINTNAGKNILCFQSILVDCELGKIIGG